MRRRSWILGLVGAVVALGCNTLSGIGDLDFHAGEPKRDPTMLDLDASIVDGGSDAAMCEPQAVPSFTFKAPGKYLGKCSDDVIGQLYDACISHDNTRAGCEDARTQLAECSSCVFGGATDTVQHPWVVYDDRIVAFANLGLCMSTFRDETAPTECGVAFGQLFACLNQACVAPCFELLDDLDAFNTCRQTALEKGICTTGEETAHSFKCTKAYEDTNPTYGFCNTRKDDQGNELDDRGYMIATARLSCGVDPAARDAGPDARP